MNKAKIRAATKELNPIDDIFFKKMAESLAFCQEILQVILEDKGIIVTECTPQFSGTNLQGRTVILDVKCTLGTGEQVNVEVQRSDNDDHQRRVRYNGAVLTANTTDTGSKFSEVPDVIEIYISKFDIFSKGKTVYHIDRVIRETGDVVDNGLREVYVNAAVNDGSDIAELMEVFCKSDSYNDKFPETSKRKRLFKENPKEAEKMNEAIQKLMDESKKEGFVSALSGLVKDGMLTLAAAAQRAGMTEEAFKKMAML